MTRLFHRILILMVQLPVRAGAATGLSVRRGRTLPEMHRYVRTLLYGILAFAVYAGISFMLGGRVNWILAAAAAAGVMLAVFFIHPRRRR